MEYRDASDPAAFTDEELAAIPDMVREYGVLVPVPGGEVLAPELVDDWQARFRGGMGAYESLATAVESFLPDADVAELHLVVVFILNTSRSVAPEFHEMVVKEYEEMQKGRAAGSWNGASREARPAGAALSRTPPGARGRTGRGAAGRPKVEIKSDRLAFHGLYLLRDSRGQARRPRDIRGRRARRVP